MIVAQSNDSDYIFVASITLKNGRRIFARDYGLRAFRLKVKPTDKRN